MGGIKGARRRCIGGFPSGRFLAVAVVLLAAGCEPLPFHLDPLSANGRDGGGSPPSYAALMRIGGSRARRRRLRQCGLGVPPGRGDRARAAAPFVGIGDTLLATSAVNEAILAYNSALARDSSDLPAQTGLAKAYLETGRPELALVPLAKALTANPGNPKLLVLLGVTKDFEGQHQQAQAYYQRGLQYAPGDAALTVDLALSLALSGNYPNAIAMLQPVAMAPAASAQERQTLALIYGLQGTSPKPPGSAGSTSTRPRSSTILAYYQTAALAIARSPRPGDTVGRRQPRRARLVLNIAHRVQCRNVSMMLIAAGPSRTMNNVGRMNTIIGTVSKAGSRAAFSSARVIRAVAHLGGQDAQRLGQRSAELGGLLQAY